MPNIPAQDFQARLGDSVFLNKEEYSDLQVAVIETPEQENVLETAFPLAVARNPFLLFHEYHKLDKYGTATESQVPGDADAIEVDGTKVRKELPFYHADFKFSIFDLNNSRQLGQRLDVSKARAARRKVDDLFDEALWNRSSVFGTLGAYAQFTGTAAAASTWDGTTPQAMFNDVVNFVKAVPAAYFSPNMRLILNHTNFHELHRTNENGLSAFELLRRAYPGLQIIVSKQVTEGTGLIYPFRDDAVYLVTGMAPRVVEWEPKPWESHFKVVRSGRLIVVAPSAGVQIGGL